MGLSKEKSKLVERLKNTRLRPREGSFLVEGVRSVRELLEGSLVSKTRFGVVSPRLSETGPGRAIRARLESLGVPLEEITDRDLALLSDTEHPQGILLVVEEPVTPLALLESRGPLRLLLLDGIQDPGNAGTLIRAARAFGLDGVVALDGTVDPFNPKVVRASAGALGHVHVFRSSWKEIRPWLEARGIPVLVADARGVDVRTATVPPSWALAIGNEGAGPRQEVLARAGMIVAVPMEVAVDSLNAGMAGAILLFALSPISGGRKES